MSAYTALLASLGAREPHGGWSDVADLPDLSDADLAAVLEEEGSLVLDAPDSEEFVGGLIMQLRAPREQAYRYALVGALLVGALQAVAHAYLLRELRCEADRRYHEAADEARHEAQYRDAMGLAADEAGVAAAGEI